MRERPRLAGEVTRVAYSHADFLGDFAREVEEEVGVRIRNTRYFASQSWPFPHSLMIAFVCDWASGEIRPQETEIEEANWFEVLQLPKLPSKISIARKLIDAVVDELKSTN